MKGWRSSLPAPHQSGHDDLLCVHPKPDRRVQVKPVIEALSDVVSRVAAARDRESALEQMVRGVRVALRATACAAYLIDPESGDLVLEETEGLDRRSVGQVRLPAGTGVIGLVREQCRALRIDDVSSHPRFLPLPITGEDELHSFLGAPMVYRGDVIGVLAIWRHDASDFDVQDEAFLVTAAVQLSGVLANTTRGKSSEFRSAPSSVGMPLFEQGVAGAPGVAVGQVVLPSPLAELDAVEDRASVDPILEAQAFLDAVEEVQRDIFASAERMKGLLPSEAHALFEVYAMLASDEGLVSSVLEGISRGSWAPGALRRTIDALSRRFDGMDDERLRTRGEDIRAVGRRLLRALHADDTLAASFPERTILYGEEVSLTRIAEVPAGKLAGIICSQGSILSHTVIIASSLGIPAVMGLGTPPRNLRSGQEVVVDGSLGRVIIEPGAQIVEQYRRLEREEARLTAELARYRDEPGRTLDDRRIHLYANMGMYSEAQLSDIAGAEGIGLYRSEYAFMLRESFPTEEELFTKYRKILADFAPRPVVMRTLDIGGDKALPYFPIAQENPVLGSRGIRVMLDHPEIFLTQLTAMLRANQGLGNLRILLPMVSTAQEIIETRSLIRQASLAISGADGSLDVPPIGAMVEVPILLFSMESIARELDFLSIGSNDLTQYLCAADRGNANVAHLYDALSPAVLRALRFAIQGARRAGIPISVCGELAGDLAGALLLVGMGVDQLSMSPSMLPRVKRILRSLTYSDCVELMKEALTMSDGKAVRALINHVIQEGGLGDMVLSR
jgi:phosphotransferase system, enzyme I, PtsP